MVGDCSGGGHFHQTVWNLLPTGGKGTFAEEGETGGERPQTFAPNVLVCGEGQQELQKRAVSHVEGSVFLLFNIHCPAGVGEQGLTRGAARSLGRTWEVMQALVAGVPRPDALCHWIWEFV